MDTSSITMASHSSLLYLLNANLPGINLACLPFLKDLKLWGGSTCSKNQGKGRFEVVYMYIYIYTYIYTYIYIYKMPGG